MARADRTSVNDVTGDRNPSGSTLSRADRLRIAWHYDPAAELRRRLLARGELDESPHPPIFGDLSE